MACKRFNGGLIAFKAVFTQLSYEYVVCIPQYPQLLFGYISEYPDAERRSRERMPSDELVLDAEGTADTAYLILEEGSQRLYNLQVHLFRQASHIVVRLDCRRRSVY